VAPRIDDWKTVVALFTENIDSVRHNQWGTPTICPDWDVRALVEHAVDYQRGYGLYLGAGDGIDAELGDDPAAAWGQVSSALIAAYDTPGALARSFDFIPFLTTVAEQIIVPTTDLLIHTWDLAHAIGADETMPSEVCEEVLAEMQRVEEIIRIPDWYGDAIEPPADADAQTRLLCFAGRKVTSGRQPRG
jgi:uncharacterized protein (TIGR03086 family)